MAQFPTPEDAHKFDAHFYPTGDLKMKYGISISYRAQVKMPAETYEQAVAMVEVRL